MMKKILSVLLAAALLLTCFVTLGACAQGSHEVRLWVFEPDTLEAKNAYKDLMKEYTEKSGANVMISFVDRDTYVDKLDNALADNHVPDVLFLNQDYLTEYAAQKTGFLIPLNNYLRISDIKMPELLENARRATSSETKIFGIPYTAGSEVLLYNKALVADADVPYTWDDLLASGEKAYKKGSTALEGLADDKYAARCFLALLSGKDGAVLNKAKTKTAFNGELGQRAAELLKSLKELTIEQGMGGDAFALGKAAFKIGDEADAAKIQKDFPDLKIGAVAVPSAIKGEKNEALLKGTALVMSKHAKNKEKAFKLIEFLCESQNVKKVTELAGGIPANKKVATADNDVSRVVAEQMQNANPLPQLAGFTQLTETLLPKALSDVFAGRSAADALSEAAEQAKGLLWGTPREASPQPG